MISVKYIHDRVENHLARKYQAGYNSVDEFNGNLRDSENLLFEYYYKQFETTQKIVDALSPFLVEKTQNISNGYVEYPSDYRHELELSYLMVQSKDDCTDPEMEEKPMIKLSANEERDTMGSTIRKPSLEKGLLYWIPVNNKIRVRPLYLKGETNFKYFRHPIFGVYGTKLDLQKQIEVYDSANSTDLEWDIQEENNIIDLLLLMKGISIRDTDLMQFASSKMNLK